MRNAGAFLFYTALMLIFTCPGLAADELKTPSFEDVLNLVYPGSPEISPDGKFVLYTSRGPVWDDNEYRTQLWMANIETGETRQLTYAKESSYGASWSPCGKYIAFVSARDEKSQVYVMPAFGGEARPVTKSETGIGSYAWSPDGKKIAYTATDEKSKHQKAVEKKYGGFMVFEEEFDINRLWLCDVASGETEKLIERDELHVGNFAWSPDGKTIAFGANPDSLLKSFSKSDLYLLDVESKEIKPLVTTEGPDGDPVWSPCGKYIAFDTGKGVDSFFLNSGIGVVPVEGGDPVYLTDSFDEDPGLAYWKEDGIYFSAFQGMSRHLFRIDPSSKQIVPVTSGEGMVASGFSLSKDGKKMAFTYVDADHFSEIYCSDVGNYEPKVLTSYSDQLDGWRLSTKEAISWKSTDGAEITGVLVKPADFDPAKEYPLLVIIHGGPTGIDYPMRFDSINTIYPLEQWCAKGAVVLMPNYRGSTGFGEAFRKLNYRNLGVGDYWDVISGVDHLIAQGFVDPEKLGAMGWSQGGYISAYITTFSDRFAAVSVGAGISDWVDYYYRTDITPFCVQYLGDTPWADPEIYRKTSPMTHINNAKTATLIQHGENDARVPINNGHKLYRGLKDRGIPVKFIIYKGFGHGISKPKERLALQTHNWQWFGKYIWGEEPEEEVFEEENEANSEK